MKSVAKFFLLLIFIPLFIVGCRHYRPYVGEIVIDTDVPKKYEGLLPLGYTLDDGDEERSLFSQDLILNGNFDEGLQYWDVLGGDISVDKALVEAKADNSFLQAIVFTKDSIAGLAQSVNPFSIEAGEEMLFSLKAYSRGASTLEITLVEDSLFSPISSPIRFTPHSEWEVLRGTLKANRSCAKTCLQVLMKSNEEGYLQQTDSTSNWRPGVVRIYLDDLKLQSAKNETRFALPSDLVSLLSMLNPSFLRYPSGEKTDKLPQHLDSLLHVEKKPIPAFGHREFIAFSESISSVPILLTNFSYGTKPSYISKLIEEIDNPNVFIQLGYDQDGLEYFYRLHAQEQKLLEDTIPFQIITSGTLLPYRRFSDYTYDRVIPPISFTSLKDLDSLIISHDYLAEPQMLGEVYFQDSINTQYSAPPLVLRAAFLTLAERNSQYLEGVGVAPLLATDLDEDYPLILVSGTHYQPTQFYHYIRYFSQLRGVQLKAIPLYQPFENGLLLSLTADKSGENYYLKAVNTTRHPLPYLMKAKGQQVAFSSVDIYSFMPSYDVKHSGGGVSDYNINIDNQKIGKRQRMEYLFAPYEVVIFHFMQKK